MNPFVSFVLWIVRLIFGIGIPLWGLMGGAFLYTLAGTYIEIKMGRKVALGFALGSIAMTLFLILVIVTFGLGLRFLR